MSLTAIPNQPVAFNEGRNAGCVCYGPTERVIARTTDVLQWQHGASNLEACAGEELLRYPDFENPSTWYSGVGSFWSIEQGSACNQTPAGVEVVLTEISWNPTPGSTYLIVAEVDYIYTVGAVANITLGGQFAGYLTNVGQFAFIVTATTADFLQIFANAGICLSQVSVRELTLDVTVDLIPEGSLTPADTFTYATDPDRFRFSGQSLTITYPLTYIAPGCYYLKVTDGCDVSQLTSIPINIGEHECSVLIQACNSGDAMGFDLTDFNPEMRVYGKLVRSTFDYDTTEDRWSNGKVDRPYADRRRKMELRIDRVGEFGHDFLSTLPLWDRIYIDGAEYIVKPETYEPDYTDVWDDVAPVILQVEPKQELVRKVRCGPDTGGCFVPPNYWVENTGPNEDYILTSATNERIELHENA